MSLTPEKRAEIVRAAKEWLGTPYHHLARIKKAGADCAMFPLSVYQECGVIPKEFEPAPYPMQWHLHRSEELYLKTIEPFAQEIPSDVRNAASWQPAPGDFIVFKFGRAFSHGAIVVDWPVIIHSYIPHGVQLGDALRDGEIIGREIKFFEVRDTKDNRG